MYDLGRNARKRQTWKWELQDNMNTVICHVEQNSKMFLCLSHIVVCIASTQSMSNPLFILAKTFSEYSEIHFFLDDFHYSQAK